MAILRPIEMSDGEIIDWEQFDSITDNGAPEFMDIFQDFLEATPGLFDSLKAAIQSQEVKDTASVSHQLKGSAANFGFVGISSPMAEIEVSARQGSFDQVVDRFDQAWAAFQAGSQAVAAKYPA